MSFCSESQVNLGDVIILCPTERVLWLSIFAFVIRENIRQYVVDARQQFELGTEICPQSDQIG